MCSLYLRKQINIQIKELVKYVVAVELYDLLKYKTPQHKEKLYKLKINKWRTTIAF